MIESFATIKTGVGGYLIVAGAGGVKLGSGGPDVRGEGGLDVEMNILELGREVKIAFLDAVANGEETGFDFFEFLLSQDSGGDLSACVRDGTTNIVFVESPIEGDGFSELLNEVCGLLSEAAFPHRGAE